MIYLLLFPFLVQTIVIMVDEFYFHIRRGLPKWERIGHPLDTLTVLICFSFVLLVPYSSMALKFYIGLAIFSCLFVTKDEFVHKECCPASEQWLHALLFLNHPVVLTSAGLLWTVINASSPLWLQRAYVYSEPVKLLLLLQTAFVGFFFLYQSIYWNFLWKAPE